MPKINLPDSATARAVKTKWTAEKRRNLAAWQFAGTDGEAFPISDQADVQNAWDLAGHDDDPKKCRENILRIAAKLGLDKPKGADEKEGDETKEDLLVNFGSAIKSDDKDPYKGGVWLVIHSDADDPDMSGDFFHDGTDYGSHKSSDLYWAHGLDKEVKKERIGRANLVHSSKGVWMDYQLAKATDSGYTDKAKRYAREIANASSEQKAQIGASSGTLPHLVIRTPIEDEYGTVKAHRIDKWPLGGDASLTTMPCEPRTRPDIAASISGVYSVKSLPEASLKELIGLQQTQLSQDEPLADSTLPNYTYAKTPMLGHAMAAKMATEHSKTLTSLYRNRTISTPEYDHIEGHCTQCLKDFHGGMEDAISTRPVDDWDNYEIAYKSMTAGIKTVGDALYGAVTRAYNAGADTAHNRGYLARDEHKSLRDHFEKCRDTYLDSLDPAVRDRELKENGSSYLDIKQFPGERTSLGLTLAQQVESVLADGSALKKRVNDLASRYGEIKTIRSAKSGDLGARACAEIEVIAESLKSSADAFLSLLPNAQSRPGEGDDLDAAKAFLASIES